MTGNEQNKANNVSIRIDRILPLNNNKQVILRF